jgi:hypothetical protein
MVWVSATMGQPSSASSFIYQAFKRGDFQCVTSGPLVDEMARVLIEEFDVPREVVEDLVRLICGLAKVVSIKHQVMGCIPTSALAVSMLKLPPTSAAACEPCSKLQYSKHGNHLRKQSRSTGRYPNSRLRCDGEARSGRNLDESGERAHPGRRHAVDGQGEPRSALPKSLEMFAAFVLR